jgi:hypothetical protein
MNPAWLIYSTITLSGFPATQWTAIEYPSREICEAKAREFAAYERKPERVKDRVAKEITIKIMPRCTSQPPQFFVVDGGQS